MGLLKFWSRGKAQKRLGIWHVSPYWLILPGISVWLFINIWPLIYGLSIAPTNLSLFNLRTGDWEFTGLDNFRFVLKGGFVSAYGKSVLLSFLFVATSVPLKVLAGLSFAALYGSDLVKGKKVYRPLLIVPWAVPAFFSILIWRGLFEPDGVFNSLAASLGMTRLATVNWLFGVNRWTAFTAYNVVEVWLAYPFMMTVILAAMQSVPPDLYESAMVDGAGRWAKLRHIILPLIKRPLIFATVMTTMASFTVFFIPWLMNEGQPAGGPPDYRGENETAMYYGYREAFGYSRMLGKATAFYLLLSPILFGFIILLLKASKLTKD